jgi:glycosyltransferase involved in cell wall biosynthesis
MVAEGFSSRQVGVIYNGIDPGPAPSPSRTAEVRARLGIAPGVLAVGAVGRLDPVKDVPTLLAGFRSFVASGAPAHLVLVGDGPERSRVEQLVRESGLDARVTLTGYRADARELLSGFDVYVNSSVFEGVSLTILEAMAAGLPVVATRVGGTREVVVDEDTGLLIPSRDPRAVAEALRHLASDASRRRDFGLAGRQRVEQRFAASRMVAEYAAAYQAVESVQCVA